MLSLIVMALAVPNPSGMKKTWQKVAFATLPAIDAAVFMALVIRAAFF